MTTPHFKYLVIDFENFSIFSTNDEEVAKELCASEFFHVVNTQEQKIKTYDWHTCIYSQADITEWPASDNYYMSTEK